MLVNLKANPIELLTVNSPYSTNCKKRAILDNNHFSIL